MGWVNSPAPEALVGVNLVLEDPHPLSFFLLTDWVFSSKTPWRRGWDSNP